jgi:hypothetical protein
LGVRLVRRDEIYDSRRRQTYQDLAALPSLPETSRVAAALTEQDLNLAAGRETSQSPMMGNREFPSATAA